MKTQDNSQEIAFLSQQAKLIEGEITVPLLQRQLKIGYNRAVEVFEKLKSVPGIELAITPEPEVIEVSGVDQNQESVSIEINTADVVDIPVVAVDEIVIKSADLESAELAIVEAACAPMNLGQALGEVLRDFDLGPNLTQCRPLEGTSDLKIGRAITVLSGVRNWTELGLGDAINELEDRGHKDVIPQIISFLNLEDSHSTLDKYSRVARNVPNDLRELPNLHFTHLSEAGCSRFSKDAEEQKKAIRDVLTEASEQALNVAQTRQLCLSKKGKEVTPTPPPAQPKHGRYIVIMKDNCPMSFSTDQLPDNEDDCFIVDTLQGELSCAGCSAGIPVWQPLAYRKLEATAVEAVVEE